MALRGPTRLHACLRFDSATVPKERRSPLKTFGVKNTMLNKTRFNPLVITAAVSASIIFAATAIAEKIESGLPDQALTEVEIAGLLFMREEEKLARDSYLVLFDSWGIPVFDNISGSEQLHMDAMKALIDRYGLEDPVKDELVIGEYQNQDLQALFDTLMAKGELSATDALEVGAVIEETDIIDIHHEIDLAEQEDIISTYESLVCGSRNHLRAFVGQLELNGVIYEPEFLSMDEYLEIIEHSVERDCGKSVLRDKGRK